MNILKEKEEQDVTVKDFNMPFSILSIAFLSQGCIMITVVSGTDIDAIWFSGVKVP